MHKSADSNRFCANMWACPIDVLCCVRELLKGLNRLRLHGCGAAQRLLELIERGKCVRQRMTHFRSATESASDPANFRKGRSGYSLKRLNDAVRAKAKSEGKYKGGATTARAKTELFLEMLSAGKNSRSRC